REPFSGRDAAVRAGTAAHRGERCVAGEHAAGRITHECDAAARSDRVLDCVVLCGGDEALPVEVSSGLRALGHYYTLETRSLRHRPKLEAAKLQAAKLEAHTQQEA